MSKAVPSNGSRDVLASIRKLVADEAQEDATPSAPPVFRSTVRTPDPASVPFRHTSGARDWLVGAIDEEKRSAAIAVRSSASKPLTLKKPVEPKGVAQATAPRDWKPRISLALVNPVPPRDVAEPRQDIESKDPEKGKDQPEPKASRFQPWKQDAITDGFSRLENADKDAASKPRLLLTPEFRVSGPGEPANFNTPAPHSKPRFTLKPVEPKNPDRRKPAKWPVPEATGPALGESGARELDESMLRDVVADVVHEELRGALGERITRNVRKLVRSEINRAVEEKRLADGDDYQTR